MTNRFKPKNTKKWTESGFRVVRWLRWHCPPDTGFEIRALAVWGRARYLSVTEVPHNTDFHTWIGKKQFCFFQTAETGNRTPNSGVKNSGANHYPRAPAQEYQEADKSYDLAGLMLCHWMNKGLKYCVIYRDCINVMQMCCVCWGVSSIVSPYGA